MGTSLKVSRQTSRDHVSPPVFEVRRSILPTLAALCTIGEASILAASFFNCKRLRAPPRQPGRQGSKRGGGVPEKGLKGVFRGGFPGGSGASREGQGGFNKFRALYRRRRQAASVCSSSRGVPQGGGGGGGCVTKLVGQADANFIVEGHLTGLPVGRRFNPLYNQFVVVGKKQDS